MYINICFLGILAGLRPCGVIVMLSELFTSESKSQVYAYIHEFLRNNDSVSKKLSKYMKFAELPIWNNHVLLFRVYLL